MLINYSNPRKLALGVALAIFLFLILLMFISHLLFDIYIEWEIELAIVLITFIISYFLILFTIEQFIYKKIKLVYKTIHQLKKSKEEKKSTPKAVNINEVNSQVLQWAEEQNKEIDRLKEMAKYRREFLGNIAHELKTPIFNIQGYVLTLLEGGLEDKSVNREYLLRAEKSINRMISIVEDLDEISRLESGTLKLNLQKFDIVALTREVFYFSEIKAKALQVELNFGNNYEKSVNVIADKENIRRVLTNLVDNALKYGKPGGRVKVTFFDMGENILTEVSDNGIGIDAEKLPRLFERFYRTDIARSREQGGSGLGLAIVKHIIEAHGQTIHVRSTPNIGSTFSFTLQKPHISLF